MDRSRINRMAAEYVARFLPVWAAEAHPMDPFGPLTCIEDLTCEAMHNEGRPSKEINAVLARLAGLLADVSHEWEHVCAEHEQKCEWQSWCERTAHPRRIVNRFRLRDGSRGYIAANGYAPGVHQFVLMDNDRNVIDVKDSRDLWHLREFVAWIHDAGSPILTHILGDR